MDLNLNISCNVVVILGPTASGKTNLAVKMAHALEGEIISADSRQVYRGLDIGTGKDLKEYSINKKFIPYHLIDILDVEEEYNVVRFQKDVYILSQQVKKRGKLPILCGGTGLYLKAVLLDFAIPSVNPDKNLRTALDSLDKEVLIQKLESIAPGTSIKTPIDTKRRVIRAIEIAIQGNSTKETKHRGQETLERNTLVLGVDYPREVIRQRITTRLHQRLEEGMIEEVENLLNQGISHKRLESLGLEYRFISRYLKGEYIKEEMFSLLKTAIHQYAKKQMTFFRNMEKNGIQIHWVAEGDFEAAIKLVKDLYIIQSL